jgi:hypothetical protein
VPGIDAIMPKAVAPAVNALAVPENVEACCQMADAGTST